MNNMLLNYMTSIHFCGLYIGQGGIFSRNKKYIILLVFKKKKKTQPLVVEVHYVLNRFQFSFW